MTLATTLNIRWQGQQDYVACWRAMQQFTAARTHETQDEIWLLEHPAIFTQGQNGKQEHVLNPGAIPIVQTDRGGQVTYHGPGQLMVYTLIDLNRKKLNVHGFVTALEQAVIDLLHAYQIEAETKPKAPGVYVRGEKICSIGLRVRRGFTYHGIAFNVCMDLEPFTRIHPCGFAGLRMTQFTTLGGLAEAKTTGQELITYLMKSLGYTTANYLT